MNTWILVIITGIGGVGDIKYEEIACPNWDDCNTKAKEVTAQPQERLTLAYCKPVN